MQRCLCAMQAHTCDNILELPNYLESMVALSKAESKYLSEEQLKQALAQTMDDRLRLAISCSTYGLDEKVQS